MSSNDKRLFVGGLSYDVRQRDLEDLFGKYGPIKSVSLKSNYGFVEFEDARDAKDAQQGLDGTTLERRRIAVEASRGPRDRDDRDYGRGRDDRDSGRDRDYDRRGRGYDRRDDRGYRGRGGGGGRFSPPRNTDYRVLVENLPSGCSWQDLKDHFRTIGDVCFSDVRRDKNGKEMGIIEYKYYEDMRKAVRELDRSRMRGIVIDVFSDYRGKSHSRSRSPARKDSRSRSKSPARKDSRSRSRSKSSDRKRSPRSASPARSPARSPKADRSRSPSRSRSRSP